jgi:glycosyltransferase involved in cell wall biosynthesis
MLEPKVSIVIAAFNAANFIAETIESIIAQSYSNWEAILVDDHSTDSTGAIIKQYAHHDSRIRYQLAPRHAGRPSTNRNIGIQLATGDFITFMDSDDAYLPDALGILMQPLLQDNNLNASMAFPYYCDSHLTPLHPSPHLEDLGNGFFDFSPQFALTWEKICKRKLYLFVCSVMFRGPVLKQLPLMDETLLTGDDFKLLVDLFRLGFDKVKLLPQCTYWYRNYAGSITKNPLRLVKACESHIALTEWLFSLPELPKEMQDLKGYHLSHRLAVLTSTLTKMERPDLAWKVIFMSLRFRFISPKIWLIFFGKETVRLCIPDRAQNLVSTLLKNSTANYFKKTVQTTPLSSLPSTAVAS